MRYSRPIFQFLESFYREKRLFLVKNAYYQTIQVNFDAKVREKPLFMVKNYYKNGQL